jgi:hypothetical protein
MLRPDTDEFRRSYAEQHAAAFALLARLAGFPSRVAVGYLVTEDSKDPTAGPNIYRVTTRNAHAWPEVNLAGLGWVAFEPTDTSQLWRELPPDSPHAGGTQASPPPPAAEPAEAVVEPELNPAGEPGGGGSGAVRTGLWLGLLPALALVLALLLIAGEKARRRRHRRRAGTPAARIGGAWREVRDRLTEHGLARSRALTTHDVVGRTGDLPRTGKAAEQIEKLAPIVDTAFFAAAEPSEADAQRAWELAQLTSRELNRAGGLPRRVRATFDPRPLLPPRKSSSLLRFFMIYAVKTPPGVASRQ